MAAATSSSLLLYYQLSQAALGSSVNVSKGRNSVCCVKACAKAKKYALGVQCFQGQPPARVAYSDSGDLCAIRPVSDESVNEKVVAKPLELPSSALAIADAIGTGFTALRKSDDSKQAYTTASAEFIALCTEQLGLGKEIVGSSARFTVYIRPAESYSTGQLEFHCMAVYPSQDEEELVLKQSDTVVPISLDEAELIKQEVVEVANGSAIILPMVKDLFLIGFVVVEGVSMSPKTAKLRPVKPVWPPKKGTQTPAATLILSKQQLTELPKIARTLALACVVDQRALLLQKSNIQKSDQIEGLLEQAQGPLQAIRTLSQLMLPQFKRGEIPRDFIEDILVQGARMKDVLQQLENVTQSGPNLIQSTQDWEEGNSEELPEPNLANERRRLHTGGRGNKNDNIRRQGSLPAAYSEGRDLEAPMPPLTLAPVPDYDMTRPCDVAKVLKQLGQAANGLANQRGQNLQITSCSPLHAAVNSAGLHRACSHLLEIALQHTPKGGYVRANAMRAPCGGVLIIIEDNGSNTTDCGSVPTWRGTDLHGVLGEDIQFVQNIVERQLGGVLRVLSPRVQNGLPDGGGTYIEIWLPGVPNFKDS
ncbi:hypothetical protein KC19_3G190900 [Ceratodon purpureus]|uniref:Uncharacterized protein n=1 Tax=Ceratodon purpureus TaxID=3225 RepID=A0A8T0INM7_CERPU|nr:hypothetical protein KC19_3G190900 [Ceratodon purpureus]